MPVDIRNTSALRAWLAPARDTPTRTGALASAPIALPGHTQRPTEPAPRRFSKTAAAERLSCTRWTILRLIKSGELAVVKVAGREAIAVTELEDYVARNTRRAKQ